MLAKLPDEDQTQQTPHHHAADTVHYAPYTSSCSFHHDPTDLCQIFWLVWQTLAELADIQQLCHAGCISVSVSINDLLLLLCAVFRTHGMLKRAFTDILCAFVRSPYKCIGSYIFLFGVLMCRWC